METNILQNVPVWALVAGAVVVVVLFWKVLQFVARVAWTVRILAGLVSLAGIGGGASCSPQVREWVGQHASALQVGGASSESGQSGGN